MDCYSTFDTPLFCPDGLAFTPTASGSEQNLKELSPLVPLALLKGAMSHWAESNLVCTAEEHFLCLPPHKNESFPCLVQRYLCQDPREDATAACE